MDLTLASWSRRRDEYGRTLGWAHHIGFSWLLSLGALRYFARVNWSDAHRLVFVCSGNICRSPLAALLWEAQYPAHNAASAGFITQTGRRSPDNIQAVAAAGGLSLTEHRSRTLDEAMLRESDVIVLFEPRHFVQLRATFPRYLDRVLMLGAFLDPPQAAIDDPYQRSVAESEQIAAQLQVSSAEAVGQKAELADADQAGRQHVE